MLPPTTEPARPSDGTFSAVGLCGFGASAPQVGSETGSWRQGNGSNLWQYVGPPDGSSTFCELHRQ